jgi:hypothetical protein
LFTAIRRSSTQLKISLNPNLLSIQALFHFFHHGLANKDFCQELKVLESVSFFVGVKKLFSGTILRGTTQPLNAYGYKYFSLLLLLFYPFVVPADLSQQAKSATADGLAY